VFAHTIRKQGGAGHCSLQSLIQSLDDWSLTYVGYQSEPQAHSHQAGHT
jgi:hypothetical protein